MRVGFFYQENGPRSRPHLAIAKNLLASVRATMPGVEVWQLTDTDSPVLDGVDGVMREHRKMPMAVRRMTLQTLQSQHDRDWLFVDTDVVIRKDVRDVFDSKFDVAITDREGTITNEAAYAKVMPYNIGVVFSRSPAFWTTVIEYLVRMPLQFQHWEGDQRVIAHIMGHKNHLGYNVKILPGLKYNYPPKSADDPLIEEAAIVHLKGARKAYAPDLAKRLEAA